jgi:hypothetical protein
MAGLTADQALDLAERFHLLAQALAAYRFGRWSELTAAQRRLLEDREWTLLTASSDLITQAVGLVLESSDGSLAALRQATSEARAAFDRTQEVKRVIQVATAVVGLAAAIAAKDPSGIVSNLQLVGVAVRGGAPRRLRARRSARAAPARRRARRGPSRS